MNTQQNLASLTLTEANLSNIDAALSQLEAELVGLIALTAAQKKQATKMGEKSEMFCRQTMLALSQNPQVLPPTLNVADGLADLRAREQLRPLLMRLGQLYKRAADTDFALGSDAMSVALQGYRQLKLSGRSAGLDLQRELGNRFVKTRRAPKDSAPPSPAGG